METSHDRHTQRPLRHPAPDHVEPAARRGRGAGPDLAAHGLQPHRARVRRPLGGGLRSPGQYAGPGRDRHAGPCEFHGGIGAPFHRGLSDAIHGGGRRLLHQQSLEGDRASERSRRHHPGLPSRPAHRALLLHQPYRRSRRHRLRARRHRCLHGGALAALPEAGRSRPGERDLDGDRQGQYPPAGGDRGRHLFPDQLQRDRRPAARRDDDGVRPRHIGGSLRPYPRELARGGAGRDRQAAARQLAL